MSEFTEAQVAQIRQIVREEIRAAGAGCGEAIETVRAAEIERSLTQLKKQPG